MSPPAGPLLPPPVCTAPNLWAALSQRRARRLMPISTRHGHGAEGLRRPRRVLFPMVWHGNMEIFGRIRGFPDIRPRNRSPIHTLSIFDIQAGEFKCNDAQIDKRVAGINFRWPSGGGAGRAAVVGRDSDRVQGPAEDRRLRRPRSGSRQHGPRPAQRAQVCSRFRRVRAQATRVAHR